MLDISGQHFQNSFEWFLSTMDQFRQKFKADKSSCSQKSSNKTVLNITNNLTKYKLTHGSQFKEMLEPRDQVLEHHFDIQLEINHASLEKEYQFTGSKEYVNLVNSIKVFLVQSVSNIVSIAFKYLNDGKLQEKEAMEYAAKNIMLNIQSIFKQTINSIESNQLLINRFDPEQLKESLVYEIDEILNTILINLADGYPQAPASGGTPRMREVINEVNHVDNEENDLIFSNNLLISKYLKFTTGPNRENHLTEKLDFEREDYTEFIMEVINTAIQASQKNEEDSRERTVKQIFRQFNEKLFWIAQHKKYKTVIGSLEDKISESSYKPQIKDNLKVKQDMKDKIFTYFYHTLERNRHTLEKYNQERVMEEKHERQNLEDSIGKMHFKKGSNWLKELIDESQGGLQQCLKDNKYIIGQKIPSFVTIFSRHDIKTKKFTAKHSAILRILTKWAEYLQDIFKNSQQHIKQRLYPYKNIRNELVIIKEPGQKDKLIRQLAQEYKEVKIKFQQMIKSSSGFIAHFLASQQDQFTSSISRYSETRKVSSKINGVLTSLMLSYTSILIHHLLRAGRQIWTDKREQNINLIIFGVSDLLRAKLQCSQTSFINLLKTMYLLDSNESMRKTFKLVRIKNKLDQPANNILINYLFMGKVQCELQLSIQEPKGKQKHYYTFSHFMYELTRGKFGSIAECAIMISQLDPMITACKNDYYVQKERAKESFSEANQGIKITSSVTIRQSIDASQMLKESGTFYKNQKLVELNIKKQIFQCVNCKVLIINECRDIFITNGNEFMCNRCITTSKNPEHELANLQIQKAIMNGIQTGYLEKLNSFGELKAADNLCILSLTDSGHLHLNVIIYIQKELKIFLVKIDTKILKQVDSKNFDFGTLDYLNITNTIKNKLKKQNMAFELLYAVPDGVSSLSNKFYNLMNLKKQLVENNLEGVINSFKKFREEKSIIKTIKFKAQIISINQDHDKFETFSKIIEKLVLQQDNTEKDIEMFKYRKYKQLELSYIKQIQVIGSELKEIPSWLSKCNNFQKITIQGNQIQQIPKDQLPQSTIELFLRYNKIQKIDVSNLTNLTRLDLDSNHLIGLDLSNLINLRRLGLNNNQITQINLNTLSNLTILSLNNNQLKNVDLTNLVDLTELYLSKNQLTHINLSTLTYLTKLGLNDNKLETIDLSHLINLSILTLNSNCLTNIDLNNLTDLTIAFLKQNKLTHVDLTNLTSLTTLGLDNNQLENVDLTNLTSLTRLDLVNNQLTHIDLSHLTSLTILGLDNNHLTTIDLSNLISLTILDLDNNQLTSIDLTNLTNLTQLYLSNNSLTYIDLSNQTNLYILNLSLNKIEKIDMNNLANITTLNINDNQLIDIDLSSLINLKILHADRKGIIHYDFKQMTTLQQIIIYNGFTQQQELINLNKRAFVENVEMDLQLNIELPNPD